MVYTIEAHRYAGELHAAIAAALSFKDLPNGRAVQDSLQADIDRMRALLRDMEFWAQNSN